MPFAQGPSPIPFGKWHELFAASPAPPVDLHPTLASLTSGADTALIYGDSFPAPALLAVLAVRRTRILRPFGLRPLHSLSGLRLQGNACLGDADKTATFVDELADLQGERAIATALFEEVIEGTPLWLALHQPRRGRSARARFVRAPQPHWFLDFPTPATEYWSTLSGKTRETLRRKCRRFEHSVRRITEASQVAQFLMQASGISAASWQGRVLGLRIEDLPETRRYWEAVAKIGALRSYVLDHAGKPAAFVLGTQCGGRYRYEETAFVQDLATASPGTVLLHRLIEDLIERDTPATLDFGAGDAEYKRLFGTRAEKSTSILFVRSSASTNGWLALDAMVQGAERVSRAIAGSLGIESRLRRLLRR